MITLLQTEQRYGMLQRTQCIINAVAGIGRDDESELDQRQSTSGDIIEIGHESLAVDNASNANAFGSNHSFNGLGA